MTYTFQHTASGTASATSSPAYLHPVGMDDGYYANAKWPASGNRSVELRHVSAPDTVASTTLSRLGRLILVGNAGTVYSVATIGTAGTVYSITRSGSTISNTSIGTFTSSNSLHQPTILYLPSDGTQIVAFAYQGATDDIYMGINTSTGALDYEIGIDNTAHSSTTLGPARADRFLLLCGTDAAVELWDDTGTLIDSLATSMEGGLYNSAMAPLPSSRTVIISNGPSNKSWGIVDCSTDTLSWEYGPESLPSGLPDYITSVVTWGETIVIRPISSGGATPGTAFFGSSAAGLTEASVWVSNNASTSADNSFNAMVDARNYVQVIDDTQVYSLVTVSDRSYLRQHQSPVRTPSRLRGVDLRLRQTPIITR